MFHRPAYQHHAASVKQPDVELGTCRGPGVAVELGHSTDIAAAQPHEDVLL
jgi:hypothetical protein